MRQPSAAWLAAPATLFVLVVLAYPVCALLARSLGLPAFDLSGYAAILSGTLYLKVLWNTVEISALTTAACLVLGYPFAHLLMSVGPRTRRILVLGILVPFWTSVLVRSFAWMIILQASGPVNEALLGLGLIDEPLRLIFSRIGVLIGMVHIELPFMIFPIFVVMSRIDPKLAQAASSLGAAPLRRFLHIELPLYMPGIVAGTVLVFMMSLGYFITPALLGGRGDLMVAQLIQEQIGLFGNWAEASALTVVLLAGTFLVLLLGWRAIRLGVMPLR